MTEEQPWHSSVVAIVVHPTEPAIWLPDNGDPLLRLECDEELPTYDVEKLLEMVHERWGVRAIVLRFLEERVDRESRHVDLKYLLVPRAESLPTKGHWKGFANPVQEHSVNDPDWSVFQDVLHDLDSRFLPTRRPWADRGWFDIADGWAIAALNAVGINPDQPCEQLRTWGLSTVHRYRTPVGQVFFKAAVVDGNSDSTPGSRSLLFANEAVLLPAFSARFPGYVPHPIAVNADRVWMLLPDAGLFLGESRHVERWEAAIRIHARHQREMLGEVATLQAMGCLDRGLDRLAADIDDLAVDPEAMAFLDSHDQMRFHAAIPAIKELIAELTVLDIPDSFNHGDLHPWNIGMQGDGLVFFDWTDACITHPFLDLASFLGASRVLKNVPDARERLKMAYLNEWRGLASPAALERAADLAEMVAMVHQAVSYQHMIRSLEGPSRNDMGEGIPYWLKRLFERMA